MISLDLPLLDSLVCDDDNNNNNDDTVIMHEEDGRRMNFQQEMEIVLLYGSVLENLSMLFRLGSDRGSADIRWGASLQQGRQRAQDQLPPERHQLRLQGQLHQRRRRGGGE